MSASDTRSYRTRKFAELAGVTPRALRHYDRLGLLKPKRTESGYRAYSARDLERLEQIIALKFIGVPLRKVGFFAARTPEGLAKGLRAQRQMLEERRELLDRTIAAIGEAETMLTQGRQADPAVFRRIIEVIEMQNDTEEWNRKYEGLVNAKLARLKALSPEALADLRGQWSALTDDIRQALGEAPSSPKAQQLAARWISLLERLMGGPVDPSMLGAAGAAPPSGGWSPRATAADKDVWDFVQAALAHRR